MDTHKYIEIVNLLFSSQYHLPLSTFLQKLGESLGLRRAAVYFNRLDHRWQLVANKISEWQSNDTKGRFPDIIEYQQVFPGLETKMSEGITVRLSPSEIEALGFLKESKHFFYIFPLFDGRWWAGIFVVSFGEREATEEEKRLLESVAQSLSLAIARQKRESEYQNVSRVFQELLNHIPDVVLLLDAGGRWLLANKNFLHFLNFKRDVYHGLTFKEIADLRPAFKPLLEKLGALVKRAAGRETPYKEIIQFRSGGRRFWWEFCLIPFKCDEERRLLILGRDITSLKLAQERLLSILENLPAMVYIVNPRDQRIIYHNSTFRKYFGKNFIGQGPCFKLLFGREAPCAFCHLPKASIGLREAREFYDHKRERWLKVYEVYLSWLDENLVRLGMIQDITEFKQQEEDLIRSQKMELLGKMTGNLAHEFNNILTILKGYIDLLKMRIPQDSKASFYLERIQSAVDSGSNLIKQLLFLSRDHEEEGEIKIVDINQVITEQEELFRKLLGEGIELELDLCPQSLPVNLSFEEAQAILSNLIINARDAMPRGGKLTIQTRLEETDQGPRAIIRVSDTGEGMSEETLARIFEPFYTTKAPGEGSGLGLNIVLSLVKRVGGEIKVESKPQKGTTFEIILPLAQEIPEEGQKDLPSVWTTEESTVERKRILVVEDEPHIREMLAEMLEGRDFEVVTAANGLEALEWLRENNYEVDLIITDVVMPKMDGVQLYQALQKEAPHIILIFISGYAEHMLAKYGFDDKSFRIIKKPFTFRQLLEEIEKILD